MSENLSSLPFPRLPTPLSAQISQKALAAIGELRRTCDHFELQEGMQQCCRYLGVSSALYVHAVPAQDKPTEHFLLLDCSLHLATSIRACQSLHLHLHPWTQYGGRQTEPSLASGINGAGRLGANSAVDPEGNGFRSALPIPIHSAGGTGRFGLLCLGSADEGHFERISAAEVIVLGEALATEMHSWWMASTRWQQLAITSLRQEDPRLLGMEHQGLSTKQIARALDISCSSVDSRFQRINVKMGCANRRASALRASMHELI